MNSDTFWREFRGLEPLAAPPDWPVWRLSVPPAAGAGVVAAIGREREARAYYDWGGGLIWLALAPSDDAGHRQVRAAVPVFQPQAEALARLSARAKAGFDPHGVLNPGRMYAGV